MNNWTVVAKVTEQTMSLPRSKHDKQIIRWSKILWNNSNLYVDFWYNLKRKNYNIINYYMCTKQTIEKSAVHDTIFT